LALVLGVALLPFATGVSSAASASPTPSATASSAPAVAASATPASAKPATSTPAKTTAPAISAACRKVYTQVVNADKVYVALQYGIVKAATDYLADKSLTNRLVYNDSYITAIQAAQRELNFAINNPQCYPAKNIASYKAGIKSILTEIDNIHSANVNGQVFGDPKKMSTSKPVGLLQ